MTPNAFLPSGVETTFRVVKRSIAQDENAHRFLVELGLHLPNVVDEVLDAVLPHYVTLTKTVPDTYYQDIASMVKAVNSVNPEQKPILKAQMQTTPFLLAANFDRSKLYWSNAGALYQRTEETETWFVDNPEARFVSDNLSEQPGWPDLASFLQVATALSVTARPSDVEGYVVITQRHGNHVRGKHRFDPDATVPGITHALETITAAKAKILWQLLLTNDHLLRGCIQSSSYKNYSWSNEEWKFSDIGERCRNAAWMPSGNDFQKPCDVQLSDLPAEWETDTDRARTVSYRLGFKQIVKSEIELLAEKEAVPADAMKDFLAAYKRNPEAMRLAISAVQTELQPYNLTANGKADMERYRAKLSQEVEDAPEKTFANRERRIRTSSNDAKEEATGLLRLWYTHDEQMICQICRYPMPFQRLDGKPYFETVECVLDRTLESAYCYLALCPLCAAKFQYANNTTRNMTDFQTLREEIGASAAPEIAITLAGQLNTIQFDGRHWTGLRLALGYAGAI